KLLVHLTDLLGEGHGVEQRVDASACRHALVEPRPRRRCGGCTAMAQPEGHRADNRDRGDGCSSPAPRLTTTAEQVDAAARLLTNVHARHGSLLSVRG